MNWILQGRWSRSWTYSGEAIGGLIVVGLNYLQAALVSCLLHPLGRWRNERSWSYVLPRGESGSTTWFWQCVHSAVLWWLINHQRQSQHLDHPGRHHSLATYPGHCLPVTPSRATMQAIPSALWVVAPTFGVRSVISQLPGFTRPTFSLSPLFLTYTDLCLAVPSERSPYRIWLYRCMFRSPHSVAIRSEWPVSDQGRSEITSFRIPLQATWILRFCSLEIFRCLLVRLWSLISWLASPSTSALFESTRT